MTRKVLWRAIAHATAHPYDALVLVRAGWTLRTPGWWRRAPFLPVPSSAYWRFRMLTALGSSEATPSLEDMVAAAKWSIRQRVGR